MAKPIKPRHQEVIISDHAWYERWPERAGVKLSRKKVIRIIRGQLTNDAHSRGIKLDNSGAVLVEVLPWLSAYLRLTDRGWLVTTFIPRSGREVV